MTVVVTRNAPGRYRGFLASVMLEVSPGTYVSPNMNAGVRERLWSVCLEWSAILPPDGSVTILWRDARLNGGLGLEAIGVPKAEFANHDGLWMDRHDLTAAHRALIGGAETPAAADSGL